MRLTFALAAATTLAATLPASTAAAALMMATYRGAAYGVDNAGIFGPAGDVAGPFRATFIYDTELGTRWTTALNDQVSGGVGFGTVSPVLSASLTINGVTRTFDAPTCGSADSNSASGYSAHSATETTCTPYDDTDAETFLSAYLYYPAPGDLEAPVWASLTPDSFSGGSAAFYRLEGDTMVTDFLAHLSPTRVIIASAIPEPATWALMLGGFAATGLAIRARRRRGPAATPRPGG